MTKGVIYYTGFGMSLFIMSVCQKVLQSNFDGEIVSVSLNKPLDLGKNIVVEGERGYPSMIKQILTALEHSTADYVFFCEHDVLYPMSHFSFTPPQDDIFYYNRNVWRWKFGSDKVIRYDRMLPLSCLCVNREFALEHYKMRKEAVDNVPTRSFDSRDPIQVRLWGYEPGLKKIKRGGLSDDDFDTWYSEDPVIDIRHKHTYSPAKITLDSFRHKPLWWEEEALEKAIPGWDLQTLFELA